MLLCLQVHLYQASANFLTRNSTQNRLVVTRSAIGFTVFDGDVSQLSELDSEQVPVPTEY